MKVYTADEKRNANLKSLYKITLDEYNKMLADQGGRCAICPTLQADTARNFVVDHDHACCPGNRSCGKCVRGLLCWNCNIALGQLKDNVDVLRSMIEYLSRPRFDI